MDYDPWGVVTATGGTGGPWSTQPFGYAGGMYDAATGLVRFGVRDYDPETGRWTAKEPLGFAAETNFYQYAGNDPATRIDPTGRIWWLVVGGLAAAAATGLASDRSGDPNSSPLFPVEVATAGLSGPVARVAGTAAKKLLAPAATAVGARMCGAAGRLPRLSEAIPSLGRTNARVFQRAAELVQEAPSFSDDLAALSRATTETVGQHAQVHRLGELGGNSCFGSARAGVGIVTSEQGTSLVRVPRGGAAEVLGRFR